MRPVSEQTALPPIDDLISGRPGAWSGMQLEWSRPDDPDPVFICPYEIPAEHELTARVFLYGARYDLSDVLADGQSLGDGYFLEFFVAERSLGAWSVHRLVQRASVTYCEEAEPGDYVRARAVKNPDALSIHAPPAWQASEAHWPTREGTLMQFVGQTTLPDNPVTRDSLTWEATLYLFWSAGPGTGCFKLVEQDLSAQTAAEHYADEERRWGTEGG